MSYILGGWLNERLDGPRDRWKANVTVVKATIRFAEATGRLSSEYGKGHEDGRSQQEVWTQTTLRTNSGNWRVISGQQQGWV